MHKNISSSQEITIGSFCSGYCGLEMGIRAGIGRNTRTIFYCEREMYAVANIIAKIEENKLDEAPVYTDIKTFPMERFRGKVHGITAGYPCQPFSCAGKRKGSDDERHLWPYIKQAVGVIRPHWCFFENVEGHISMGLSTVVSDLEGLGYAVSWGLFSAAEVGAPHGRKRVFILAHTLRVGRRGGSHGADERESGTLQAKGSGELAATWPARPGQEQYEWEEPRTIKPKMGKSVDGYSSYVDELRLLGNGVVPQQACKAWLTLKRKSIMFIES